MSKSYELTVWYEPGGSVCAICGERKHHGIGVENKKDAFDVCDDCAGRLIVAAVKRRQDYGKWVTKKLSKRAKVTAYERGGQR